MTRPCISKIARFSSMLPQKSYRWSQTLRLIIGLTLLALPNGNSTTAEETMTPFELSISTPKGMLKNPYPDPASVAQEGLEIYRSLDCNGCHGGGGGGGMAPPLTNPIWIYGKDDDTLFRVITLGTGSLSPDDAFRKQGYTRKGFEAVVGPMPPYGAIIKNGHDVWKIISWIRSLHPTSGK